MTQPPPASPAHSPRALPSPPRPLFVRFPMPFDTRGALRIENTEKAQEFFDEGEECFKDVELLIAMTTDAYTETIKVHKEAQCTCRICLRTAVEFDYDVLALVAGARHKLVGVVSGLAPHADPAEAELRLCDTAKELVLSIVIYEKILSVFNRIEPKEDTRTDVLRPLIEAFECLFEAGDKFACAMREMSAASPLLSALKEVASKDTSATDDRSVAVNRVLDATRDTHMFHQWATAMYSAFKAVRDEA